MAEQARLVDKYSDSGLRTQAADSSVSQSAPSTMQTNPQRRITVENVVVGEHLRAGGLNLHGDTRPNIQIANEKPEHRIMVYLKAQGYTNREIAKATGYTEPWVSQVTRQPWFKERLATEIREAGLDPIKQFLSSEALPSLTVLANIRDNEQVSAAARVAATNALLDRAFGKPTQHIQSETTVNVKNAKDTVERLEAELQQVEEQLASRGIHSAN